MLLTTEIMCVISVIVPTFNSQATLAACLDSIIFQSYNDIEIVIIDGGSTDSTLDIVKNAATKFENIRWNSELDAGIYDAMNKGVESALGDWVYFLGSDDCIYDPQVFADIARILVNRDFDMVYGDAVMVSNLKREGGEFNMHKLLTHNNICHQAIFYKKSVFLHIGKFNLEYPIVADWDFNVRCFRAFPEKIKYFSRIIVLFNNISGISSTSQNDPFYELMPAFHKGKIWLLENRIRDLQLSREYKIGSTIYNLFKRIGFISLLKKFQ